MNIREQSIRNLLVLALVVEARDPYTGGHLWRVSRYSRMLSEDGGLSPLEVARISFGGFLHDLGKIAIPDAILKKPAPLTEEEFAVIKTHPRVGRRLLTDHPLERLIESALYGHHERPDGQGYPEGLTEDRILVDAKIVGICDAFDAMTSTRPYRKGMPISTALSVIGDNLGTQFDRKWGERFLELNRVSGLIDHVVGHSEDGLPLLDCPMCQAPLAISKDKAEGDPVFCRSCGSETFLWNDGTTRGLTPTGRMGTPSDLEPMVDRSFIKRMVQEFGFLGDSL